jgi:hypothetical protein
MADRAPAIAAFLTDAPTLGDPDAIVGAIISRWPDATMEEIQRATSISMELVNVYATEAQATVDAILSGRGLYFGLCETGEGHHG